MPIDATTVVQRILTMLGNKIEYVTLARRAAGDESTTSTTWACHVQPAKKNLKLALNILIGAESCNLELYKVDQTVEPREGDKITDASGIVWEIKWIDVKIDRYAFNCFCIRDK